ncbi:MAG TPA: TlpA disulfide reductase family protein [Flavobacterium sp.]|jgi:thiol-disulfide isomerase/thioredoxin
MKIITIFLFAAMVTASCSQAQKSSFSNETMKYELQSLDGTDKAFADIMAAHRGKAVVIEFWASWCGDCVKAMPKLKQLQADHPEVAYVFISLDKTAEKWQAGISKHELKGDHFLVTDPEGMKGTFGKSVDLDWIPRYMILDKDGKIKLYRAIETDFDLINSTLNQLK